LGVVLPLLVFVAVAVYVVGVAVWVVLGGMQP
jgi:hypothetical protein